ncbi:hypothetical protein VTN96DRAFT_10162 [Rasamsonia emersonii]
MAEADALREFDPDGDVILVLKNPNTAFAVWDKSKDYKQPSQPFSTLANSSTQSANPSSTQKTPSQPTQPAAPAPSKNDTQTASDEPSNKKEEIQMKVSSHHLTLASPYFKAMLKGAWKEGEDLRRDGSVQIYEEGWDPEALTIVMNIIHCHFRKVPRQVSHDMLAKIIAIVDYYKCIEVIEPFSERWIDQLKGRLASTPELRSIVLWVWISWMLRLKEDFKIATLLASKHNRGPLQTLGLPIPEAVIDEIEEQRQQFIERLLDSLHDLVDKIRTGKHKTLQSIILSNNIIESYNSVKRLELDDFLPEDEEDDVSLFSEECQET